MAAASARRGAAAVGTSAVTTAADTAGSAAVDGVPAVEGERDIELHADRVAAVVGRARAAEALQLLQRAGEGRDDRGAAPGAGMAVAGAGQAVVAADGRGAAAVEMGLDSATRYQVGRLEFFGGVGGAQVPGAKRAPVSV